jgi:hypothetical protein
MKYLAAVGLIALAGCAAPVQQQAAETAPKYKTCPIYGVELGTNPGIMWGPLVVLQPQPSSTALEARARREAAEQSPSTPCPEYRGLEVLTKTEPTTTIIESNTPSRPPVCSWAGPVGGCN